LNWIIFNETLHSVGLHWTRDRAAAQISTLLHTTLKQTSMPPLRFGPAIPACMRPQAQALGHFSLTNKRLPIPNLKKKLSTRTSLYIFQSTQKHKNSVF